MERGFKRRAAAVFGTPESSLGEPRIVVMRRAVCIENHRGIERYDDCCMIVSCELGTVRITGSGLAIKRYRHDDIIVTGRICSVDMEGCK